MSVGGLSLLVPEANCSSNVQMARVSGSQLYAGKLDIRDGFTNHCIHNDVEFG